MIEGTIGRRRLLAGPARLFAALVLTSCAGVAPAGPAAGASPSPAGSDVCRVGADVYCALNPAVSDANVHETICNPAWTRGLRPPVEMTDS